MRIKKSIIASVAVLFVSVLAIFAGEFSGSVTQGGSEYSVEITSNGNGTYTSQNYVNGSPTVSETLSSGDAWARAYHLFVQYDRWGGSVYWDMAEW